jgi:hypothetical protein
MVDFPILTSRDIQGIICNVDKKLAPLVEGIGFVGVDFWGSLWILSKAGRKIGVIVDGSQPLAISLLKTIS